MSNFDPTGTGGYDWLLSTYPTDPQDFTVDFLGQTFGVGTDESNEIEFTPFDEEVGFQNIGEGELSFTFDILNKDLYNDVFTREDLNFLDSLGVDGTKFANDAFGEETVSELLRNEIGYIEPTEANLSTARQQIMIDPNVGSYAKLTTAAEEYRYQVAKRNEDSFRNQIKRFRGFGEPDEYDNNGKLVGGSYIDNEDASKDSLASAKYLLDGALSKYVSSDEYNYEFHTFNEDEDAWLYNNGLANAFISGIGDITSQTVEETKSKYEQEYQAYLGPDYDYSFGLHTGENNSASGLAVAMLLDMAGLGGSATKMYLTLENWNFVMGAIEGVAEKVADLDVALPQVNPYEAIAEVVNQKFVNSKGEPILEKYANKLEAVFPFLIYNASPENYVEFADLSEKIFGFKTVEDMLSGESTGMSLFDWALEGQNLDRIEDLSDAGKFSDVIVDRPSGIKGFADNLTSWVQSAGAEIQKVFGPLLTQTIVDSAFFDGIPISSGINAIGEVLGPSSNKDWVRYIENKGIDKNNYTQEDASYYRNLLQDFWNTSTEKDSSITTLQDYLQTMGDGGLKTAYISQLNDYVYNTYGKPIDQMQPAELVSLLNESYNNAVELNQTINVDDASLYEEKYRTMHATMKLNYPYFEEEFNEDLKITYENWLEAAKAQIAQKRESELNEGNQSFDIGGGFVFSKPMLDAMKEKYPEMTEQNWESNFDYIISEGEIGEALPENLQLATTTSDVLYQSEGELPEDVYILDDAPAIGYEFDIQNIGTTPYVKDLSTNLIYDYNEERYIDNIGRQDDRYLFPTLTTADLVEMSNPASSAKKLTRLRIGELAKEGRVEFSQLFTYLLQNSNNPNNPFINQSDINQNALMQHKNEILGTRVNYNYNATYNNEGKYNGFNYTDPQTNETTFFPISDYPVLQNAVNNPLENTMLELEKDVGEYYFMKYTGGNADLLENAEDWARQYNLRYRYGDEGAVAEGVPGANLVTIMDWLGLHDKDGNFVGPNSDQSFLSFGRIDIQQGEEPFALNLSNDVYNPNYTEETVFDNREYEFFIHQGEYYAKDKYGITEPLDSDKDNKDGTYQFQEITAESLLEGRINGEPMTSFFYVRNPYVGQGNFNETQGNIDEQNQELGVGTDGVGLKEEHRDVLQRLWYDGIITLPEIKGIAFQSWRQSQPTFDPGIYVTPDGTFSDSAGDFIPEEVLWEQAWYASELGQGSAYYDQVDEDGNPVPLSSDFDGEPDWILDYVPPATAVTGDVYDESFFATPFFNAGDYTDLNSLELAYQDRLDFIDSTNLDYNQKLSEKRNVKTQRDNQENYLNTLAELEEAKNIEEFYDLGELNVVDFNEYTQLTNENILSKTDAEFNEEYENRLNALQALQDDIPENQYNFYLSTLESAKNQAIVLRTSAKQAIALQTQYDDYIATNPTIDDFVQLPDFIVSGIEDLNNLDVAYDERRNEILSATQEGSLQRTYELNNLTNLYNAQKSYIDALNDTSAADGIQAQLDDLQATGRTEDLEKITELKNKLADINNYELPIFDIDDYRVSDDKSTMINDYLSELNQGVKDGMIGIKASNDLFIQLGELLETEDARIELELTNAGNIEEITSLTEERDTLSANVESLNTAFETTVPFKVLEDFIVTGFDNTDDLNQYYENYINQLNANVDMPDGLSNAQFDFIKPYLQNIVDNRANVISTDKEIEDLSNLKYIEIEDFAVTGDETTPEDAQIQLNEFIQGLDSSPLTEQQKANEIAVATATFNLYKGMYEINENLDTATERVETLESYQLPNLNVIGSTSENIDSIIDAYIDAIELDESNQLISFEQADNLKTIAENIRTSRKNLFSTQSLAQSKSEEASSNLAGYEAEKAKYDTLSTYTLPDFSGNAFVEAMNLVKNTDNPTHYFVNEDGSAIQSSDKQKYLDVLQEQLDASPLSQQQKDDIYNDANNALNTFVSRQGWVRNTYTQMSKKEEYFEEWKIAEQNLANNKAYTLPDFTVDGALIEMGYVYDSENDTYTIPEGENETNLLNTFLNSYESSLDANILDANEINQIMGNVRQAVIAGQESERNNILALQGQEDYEYLETVTLQNAEDALSAFEGYTLPPFEVSSAMSAMGFIEAFDDEGNALDYLQAPQEGNINEWIQGYIDTYSSSLDAGPLTTEQKNAILQTVRDTLKANIDFQSESKQSIDNENLYKVEEGKRLVAEQQITDLQTYTIPNFEVTATNQTELENYVNDYLSDLSSAVDIYITQEQFDAIKNVVDGVKSAGIDAFTYEDDWKKAEQEIKDLNKLKYDTGYAGFNPSSIEFGPNASTELQQLLDNYIVQVNTDIENEVISAAQGQAEIAFANKLFDAYKDDFEIPDFQLDDFVTTFNATEAGDLDSLNEARFNALFELDNYLESQYINEDEFDVFKGQIESAYDTAKTNIVPVYEMKEFTVTGLDADGTFTSLENEFQSKMDDLVQNYYDQGYLTYTEFKEAEESLQLSYETKRQEIAPDYVLPDFSVEAFPELEEGGSLDNLNSTYEAAVNQLENYVEFGYITPAEYFSNREELDLQYNETKNRVSPVYQLEDFTSFGTLEEGDDFTEIDEAFASEQEQLESYKDAGFISPDEYYTLLGQLEDNYYSRRKGISPVYTLPDFTTVGTLSEADLLYQAALDRIQTFNQSEYGFGDYVDQLGATEALQSAYSDAQSVVKGTYILPEFTVTDTEGTLGQSDIQDMFDKYEEGLQEDVFGGMLAFADYTSAMESARSIFDTEYTKRKPIGPIIDGLVDFNEPFDSDEPYDSNFGEGEAEFESEYGYGGQTTEAGIAGSGTIGGNYMAKLDPAYQLAEMLFGEAGARQMFPTGKSRGYADEQFQEDVQAFLRKQTEDSFDTQAALAGKYQDLADQQRRLRRESDISLIGEFGDRYKQSIDELYPEGKEALDAQAAISRRRAEEASGDLTPQQQARAEQQAYLFGAQRGRQYDPVTLMTQLGEEEDIRTQRDSLASSMLGQTANMERGFYGDLPGTIGADSPFISGAGDVTTPFNIGGMQDMGLVGYANQARLQELEIAKSTLESEYNTARALNQDSQARQKLVELQALNEEINAFSGGLNLVEQSFGVAGDLFNNFIGYFNPNQDYTSTTPRPKYSTIRR